MWHVWIWGRAMTLAAEEQLTWRLGQVYKREGVDESRQAIGNMLGRTLAAWAALLLVLALVQPQVKAGDSCSEPEEPGPCKGKVTRYYFDVQGSRCRRFWYGGCQGNKNNFNKMSKCKNSCERGKNKKKDRKRGRKSRKGKKECEEGFKRLGRRCVKEEQASCPSGYKRVKDRCVKIRTLECHEGFKRIGNKCIEVQDGGRKRGGKRKGGKRKGGRGGGGKRKGGKRKGGNTVKVSECLFGKWCGKTKSRPKKCSGGYRLVGIQCVKKVKRRCPRGYYRDGNTCVQEKAVFCPRGYARKRGRCTQIEPPTCPFGYLRVGKRCIRIGRRRCPDGFIRVDGKCFLAEAEDRCELPKSKGPCRARLTRYYFDSDSGKCRKFTYGGCGGNNNRFPSRARCQEVCQEGRRCPKKYKRIGKGCVEVDLVEAETRDRCELPKRKGPCHKKLLRFYYDSDDGKCRRFYYGGCDGNKNRFISRSRCKEVCGEDEESPCHLDFEGNCVEKCPKGYTADDGVCVRIRKCPRGLLRLRDTCVHKCPDKFLRFKSSCVRKCPKGYKKRGKVCRRKGWKPKKKSSKCPNGYRWRGRCRRIRKKKPRCGRFIYKGKCVRKCPSFCIVQGNLCIVRRRDW